MRESPAASLRDSPFANSCFEGAEEFPPSTCPFLLAILEDTLEPLRDGSANKRRVWLRREIHFLTVILAPICDQGEMGYSAKRRSFPMGASRVTPPIVELP